MPCQNIQEIAPVLGPRQELASPLMTKMDGTLASGRDFNKLLVPLTIAISKPDGKHILSHSFRSGIPTSMTRAGYSDLEIQRQER